MKGLREKKKLRDTLYSKKVLFFLVLFTLFCMRGTWNLYQKSKEAEVDEKRVAYELDELTKRQVFLQGELKRLGTVEGQENEIRSKFNVKKEGEEVAMVVLADTNQAVGSKSVIGGFLDHFWSSFVDIFK
jgi:Tfp pilus assembly protein PilO